MKNILFILTFVLISLSGFSQTFSLSSSTSGVTHNAYTVIIPAGNGYTYSYSITARNSTVYVISEYRGTLGMLSNPSSYQQQTSGSGNVPGGIHVNHQYQDGIHLVVANGASNCYGQATISVSPY